MTPRPRPIEPREDGNFPSESYFTWLTNAKRHPELDSRMRDGPVKRAGPTDAIPEEFVMGRSQIELSFGRRRVFIRLSGVGRSAGGRAFTILCLEVKIQPQREQDLSKLSKKMETQHRRAKPSESRSVRTPATADSAYRLRSVRVQPHECQSPIKLHATDRDLKCIASLPSFVLGLR
jgi:hypothetical protein